MTEGFGGYFQGRRVLLTGHTGFKGSWLSLWLLRLGARVCGYSLQPPTKPALFDVLDIDADMHSVIGDIRDSERLCAEVAVFQPEVIFHLAAQPLVRLSYAQPVQTYETNIMGTIHLLEAVRKTPTVKGVVCVTSDKCYENREWVYGYREEDQVGGHDPYSSSKACAEIVVAAYRRSFFQPTPSGSASHPVVATARAGNVVGGGDWADDRLVPDCIRGLSSGQGIAIRNPSALRPWQHVLEPLSGYLWLAATMNRDPRRFGERWNFGPPDSNIVPVKRVAELCTSCWGGGRLVTSSEPNAPHEASILKLDTSKSAYWLGWHGILPIEDTIELTVGWYKRYYSGEGATMRSFSEAQIDAYHHAARSHGLEWSR